MQMLHQYRHLTFNVKLSSREIGRSGMCVCLSELLNLALIALLKMLFAIDKLVGVFRSSAAVAIGEPAAVSGSSSSSSSVFIAKCKSVISSVIISLELVTISLLLVSLTLLAVASCSFRFSLTVWPKRLSNFPCKRSSAWFKRCFLNDFKYRNCIPHTSHVNNLSAGKRARWFCSRCFT